jgi:hypothetical protein
VTPCVDYFFKVIASEDWKGLREDFKMYSEVVGYKLEYTPKFIKAISVKERRKGEEVLTRAEERDARRKAQLTARARQEDRRRMMEQQGVGNIFR